ncbi:diguanylate cyclase [Duganella sp.]|uniref:sensor domain-containing diguanylate cyclase n=1 Tax=Duganella sp. TaxID=1904440 RepID=UPI0031D72C63
MSAVIAAPDVDEYEALLQFLYMAPVGLVQLATDGGILMLNPLSAQLMMPLSREGELTNLFDALAPVAPDLRQMCAAYAADSGQICDAIRLYLYGDQAGQGPQVLSLSMLKLDPTRLMAVLSDVTEQDRRERQLRNTDAWLHAIMTNIADYALVSLDQRGRVAAWNDSIGRVTGHGQDAVGQPYALFYPDDATTPMQQLDRLREADDNGWSLDEGMRRRADGSQFWASALIAPLPGRLNEDSGEPAYCMIIRDISDKREISQSLRQAAYCDHLTGLSNRRAFFESAELELARNKKMPRPISLIMLDADHFKAINDNYGHPAGDAVLCRLAATMRAVCREVDVLARIGGEEFAMLLPSVGLEDALAVAERLRAQVQRSPVLYQRQRIPCTVSLGVAVMDDSTPGFESLLARADQALYQAKRRGRNQVASWQD